MWESEGEMLVKGERDVESVGEREGEEGNKVERERETERGGGR